jgi:hypothetical protein
MAMRKKDSDALRSYDEWHGGRRRFNKVRSHQQNQKEFPTGVKMCRGK